MSATLASDFGVEVAFRETTTICIEQLVGSGAAADPAPVGAGVEFRLELELGSLQGMYGWKSRTAR